MTCLLSPGARRWWALTLVIAASAARAMDPHLAGLAGERPLHVRLALADAVAIGTIADTAPGRIRVRDAVGLEGAPAGDFALKRAPSRPPGLDPGDRVLLLLRGQRSPYLLVDRAPEIVRIDDAGSEAAWRDAVTTLRAAGDSPAERVALYARWLDAEPTSLRRVALLGLGAEGSLPPALLDRIAREATDPAASSDLRLAAARAAGRSEAGSRALFARLPGGSAADPAVLAAAFGASLGGRSDARAAALRRTLAHPRADVRLVGLRYGTHVTLAPDVRATIARLATDDPDPEVRSAANRALR